MALPHHTTPDSWCFWKTLYNSTTKFHPWPFGTGIKCLVGGV